MFLVLTAVQACWDTYVFHTIQEGFYQISFPNIWISWVTWLIFTYKSIAMQWWISSYLHRHWILECNYSCFKLFQYCSHLAMDNVTSVENRTHENSLPSVATLMKHERHNHKSFTMNFNKILPMKTWLHS